MLRRRVALCERMHRVLAGRVLSWKAPEVDASKTAWHRMRMLILSRYSNACASSVLICMSNSDKTISHGCYSLVPGAPC